MWLAKHTFARETTHTHVRCVHFVLRRYSEFYSTGPSVHACVFTFKICCRFGRVRSGASFASVHYSGNRQKRTVYLWSESDWKRFVHDEVVRSLPIEQRLWQPIRDCIHSVLQFAKWTAVFTTNWLYSKLSVHSMNRVVRAVKCASLSSTIELPVKCRGWVYTPWIE